MVLVQCTCEGGGLEYIHVMTSHGAGNIMFLLHVSFHSNLFLLLLFAKPGVLQAVGMLVRSFGAANFWFSHGDASVITRSSPIHLCASSTEDLRHDRYV